MSLPDYLLDEPDYCEAHGWELPCPLCRKQGRDDHDEERLEQWFEEGGRL